MRRKQHRRYRPLVCEMLEPRRVLAATPLLWMEDNNLGIAGGRPDDFLRRFQDPETWEYSLRAIDTISLRESSLRYVDPIPDDTIRNVIAPVLNANQVDVAIDTGDATWLHRRMATNSLTAEQALAPHFAWLQSLVDDGLRLKTITLQSVLSKKHPDDARWEDYSVEDRIDDVFTYVLLLKQQFPQIDVGIIDALPTHGRDWQTIYRATNQALANYGGLDHVHLDMPTDLVGPGKNHEWSDVIEVQQFVHDQLGAEFGYLLTSSNGGNTSARQWRNDSIVGLAAYQDALRAAQIDDQPDRIIVMSWFPHPIASVPEATPAPLIDAPGGRAESLTALVRQSANYLRGLDDWSDARLSDEVTQVPPVAASASTALSTAFAPDNAGFARGVVDGKDVRSDLQWQADPTDNAPWLKVDLAKGTYIDQVRLWPYQPPLPTTGTTPVTIYVSQTGIGDPIANPNEWQVAGNTELNLSSKSFVDVDIRQLDGSVRFAASVALTFDPTGSTPVGLAALRLYSPNNNWNQPFVSPLPSYPHIDAVLQDVFEHTPGAEIATLLADNRPATEQYILSVDDSRFTFDGSLLKLRSGTSLDRDATDALAVWVTLTRRSNAADVYPKLVTFSVIDEAFRNVIPPLAYDFGDAPDTYRTWPYNGGGPVHRTEGPILGTQRTADSDGKPSPNADADEGDDGVVFAGLTIGSQEASIQVQVTGEIINGGFIDAWIDFNGDGSFGGAYEQIVKRAWVTNGVTTSLSFPIPADARPGYTYARVRASSSGGLPPSYPLPLNFDLAPDGEVEDYRVQLSSPAAGGMQFVKHIAASPGDGMRSVVPVDLDQDGDIDFLTASVHNDNLAWLENRGDASFVTHQIAYVQFLRLAYPVDIDADGDLDVVTTVTGEGDRVILFENNGSESFTQRIIAINFDGADTISAADVNADGRLDILVGSYADDRFRIIENQGSGTFVASELGIAGTPRSIIPADMDRDGNLDIIVASHRDNTVAFYRGDRFGSFDHIVIDDQFVNPQIAVPVDFDLDGDVDIVAGQVNGSEIRWYEQTQAGVFTKRVAVSQQLWPRDLAVADLDGDGDMDMVVVEEAQGDAEDAVVAYVNDGTMQFARLVVGGGFANAHAVWVADVDGDGDLDVAVASRDDEDVVWFEQTGFGFDFGDAPDTYRTWPQNGGPAHRAEGPMLGVLRTADTDGQPSPNADADEGDDGVTFGLLKVGSEGSQSLVDVSNAPAGAFIDAWIDFNGNGTFDDSGEQIAARFPVSNDITNTIQFAIPATAQAGVTYARVRISSIGGLPPSSDSPVPISQRPDGEVEDYQVTIEPSENGPVQPDIHWQSFPVVEGDDGATIAKLRADCCNADGLYLLSVDDSRFRFTREFLQLQPGQSLDRSTEPSVTVRVTLTDKQDPERSFTVDYSFNVLSELDGNGTPRNYYDFGDAPFVYKTTAYPDSPRHVVGELRLGTRIDPEPDGQNHYQALGDDIDSDGNDDDGVRFATDVIASHSPTIATVIVESSGDAMLDAWIDFNRNGKFDHPQEHLSQNQLGTSIQLRSGENTISFVVPDWAIAGYTYARFRLSSQGGLMPTGIAADGEIEDYALTIVGDNVVPGSGIFREHVVSTSAIGARAVVATDVDRDGDVDLLSVSDLNHDISWYENDGQENFTRHAIGGAHFAIAMHPVDMEGDGDLDIVAASFGGNDSGVLGNVFWFENDGQQNFTRRVVGASVAGPHSVFTADMDADGDLDVLVAASDENTVSLYLNDGDQQFTRQMIDSNSRRARGVHATDLDGDGDLDILAASQDDNTVAWYENDSQGNFTKFIIDDEATGTQNAFPADVDGDGDLDVIAGWREGQAIAWYENQGDPQFVRHFVDSQSSAKYAMAIDMDGDGDVDVLAADAENGSVLIYENDGTGIFTRQLVADNTPKVQWAVAYDIDRDGDLDVASASWADNKIAWYENNALPTLSAPMSVEVGEDSPAFTIDVSDVTPGGRENQQVRFTVISDFRLKPFTFTGVEYDAVSGIGRLSVTPLPNAFGTSDVILQLEDAGLDNDFSTTEDNAVIRQVITISVTPVNDQPVAQALEAETDEDTSIRVLLPVMDIEGLETASVSITNASVVPLGAVGFEIISGSIWLTYDPSQVASIQAMGRLDSMTETIAYEVNDGDGGKTEAVITILVRGKNDWYHHSMPLDVNGNMTIEPLDVLVIINRLNSDGSGALAGLIGDPDAWYDVNDDGSVSPIDALIIINHLNGGTAEGERIASGLSPSGYYREIPAAVPKSQTVPRSDARSSVDPRQELAIGYPAFTTSTPGFEYDDTDDNWKEIDELIDLFVRDTAPKGDWWQE